MTTIKVLQKVILFFCVCLAFISCETTENEGELMTAETSSISNATFVVQRETNKIKTESRLQGVWKSAKSGNKYKWIFNGNLLSKSTIYSFGDVDVAQVYEVKISDGFDGEVDEFGDYIYLINKESKQGFCYQIKMINSEKMVLESKHNNRIVLTK